MKRTILLLLLICSVTFLLFPHEVTANKASVSIEAPESAVKGDEITVKINVQHDGNSMFHYTKWVYIKINDSEVSRWDYTWRKRPEDENFTKEIVYRVNEPIEIAAEANCNTHGSKGKVTKKVSLQE
jgi:desulfoferrodoxin (superoxide reductase-like protein)